MNTERRVKYVLKRARHKLILFGYSGYYSRMYLRASLWLQRLDSSGQLSEEAYVEADEACMKYSPFVNARRKHLQPWLPKPKARR